MSQKPLFLWKILNRFNQTIHLVAESKEAALNIVKKYPEVFVSPDLTSLFLEKGYTLVPGAYREVESRLEKFPNAENPEPFLRPVFYNGQVERWIVDLESPLRPAGNLGQRTQAEIMPEETEEQEITPEV